MPIVCDNLSYEKNGDIALSESMFSWVFDLARDPAEILARLHPIKRQVFDRVMAGELSQVDMVDDRTGETVQRRVNPSIAIHVKKPAGAVSVSDYATIAQGAEIPVVRDFPVKGFDEGAEPVVRLMQDHSLRVLFCSLPPKKNALGAAFNLEAFGEQLQQHVSADVLWDDHDVFYVNASEPGNVREISQFLSNYSARNACAEEPLPALVAGEPA